MVWPANVLHGAYTDGSEMRAIVIEVPSADSPVLAGEAATILAARAQTVTADESKKPVEGKLAERQKLRSDYDSSEGEPW